MFLTETRSLSPSQHGFLPRRSCVFNLILQEERVTRLLDGQIMYLVYLDSVNYRFLLAKLKYSGVGGVALNWIKFKLSDLSYQVQIDGVLSEESSCLSGNLQDSVIGPLRFYI